MYKRKCYVFFIGLVAFTMLLSSCASTQTPEIQQPENTQPPEIQKPENTQPPPAEPTSEPVKIIWWSHWSEENNKKEVINQVIADYEALHPNVDIEITWWQKKDMWPAMRSAFTAGEGFPDIFYFDSGVWEFVEAGWVEDLTDKIDWNNVTKAGADAWNYPGPNGKIGKWGIPLEAYSDNILYNTKLFEDLGIMVPEDYQFTADEFYEVATKCRAAGYDPFANAAGDSALMGQEIFKVVLLSQLGADEYLKLYNGATSWDRPEVREALEYVQKLIDVPIIPASYTTMTLAESHRYFHTEQKACMFIVGAWYTGRAFVPVDQGGQPDDFRLGFLRNPKMPNGKGNDDGIFSMGGAVSVASMSNNLDVAVDIVRFFAQPKYGNLWSSTTAIPTGLVTDPTTMPETKYMWYFDEYNRYAATVNWEIFPWVPACGEMADAYHTVFDEGLPLNLITLDEAIEKLETARAACVE